MKNEVFGGAWPLLLLVDGVGGCVVHPGACEIPTLSREQPRPQALIVLVLSIFVLLYICKVLSSDLLAVLVFNSPQR